jgi:hypothetical protein
VVVAPRGSTHPAAKLGTVRGVVATTLPDWLNTDNLRALLIVGMVILVIAAWFVFSLIRKVIVRAALLAVIVILIGAAWLKREDLSNCVHESGCECSVLGFDVPVPDHVVDRLPEQAQARCEVATGIVNP